MNKILPQYESIESVKVKIFSSAANNKRSIKDHKETNNKNIVEQGLNALVKNSNDESKCVSATLKLQANKPKGIKESRYLNIIDNLDVKISQKPAENEGKDKSKKINKLNLVHKIKVNSSRSSFSPIIVNIDLQ